MLETIKNNTIMTQSKFDKSLVSFIQELKKNKKKKIKMSNDLSKIIFDTFRDKPYVSSRIKSEEAADKFIEDFLTNKI